MKILITGKGGQLAWELERLTPPGTAVTFYSRSDLDISNASMVTAEVSRLIPDVVINAAAYTAVDKAEIEPARAYACNEVGPRLLAEACGRVDARLIHISTDFVFDGQKTSPYRPDDVTSPLGVYGASKLAGENRVLDALPDASIIIRTAWIYSAHGHNFVKTMLRLMKEKSLLNVVCDEIGTPTWAQGLAESIWRLAQAPELKGIMHWTDAGIASWYDFAVAIQDLALEKGLLPKEIPIRPILSGAYPTPAARPAFSVLDKSMTERALDVHAKHWRHQLSAMLDDLSLQTSKV